MDNDKEGTASKNLEALADLFDSDVSHRCLLVTDDIEPSYLISKGHIDTIIRKAIDLGKILLLLYVWQQFRQLIDLI